MIKKKIDSLGTFIIGSSFSYLQKKMFFVEYVKGFFD